MAKSGIYRGSPLGPECQSVDVSNGSKTVLTAPKPDFRSTPINGHHPIRSVSPFRAKTGTHALQHRFRKSKEGIRPLD